MLFVAIQSSHCFSLSGNFFPSDVSLLGEVGFCEVCNTTMDCRQAQCVCIPEMMHTSFCLRTDVLYLMCIELDRTLENKYQELKEDARAP